MYLLTLVCMCLRAEFTSGAREYRVEEESNPLLTSYFEEESNPQVFPTLAPSWTMA